MDIIWLYIPPHPKRQVEGCSQSLRRFPEFGDLVLNSSFLPVHSLWTSSTVDMLGSLVTSSWTRIIYKCNEQWALINWWERWEILVILLKLEGSWKWGILGVRHFDITRRSWHVQFFQQDMHSTGYSFLCCIWKSCTMDMESRIINLPIIKEFVLSSQYMIGRCYSTDYQAAHYYLNNLNIPLIEFSHAETIIRHK